MESKFHELPPLKRYRLMQQDLERKHHNRSVASLSCLPAKKRKQPWDQPPTPPPLPPATTAAVCLPAKKRVWALPPASISSFDLNVEYKPPIDEEEEIAQEADTVPIANSIDEIEELEGEKNGTKGTDEMGEPKGDVDEEEVNARKTEEGNNSNIIYEIEEREKEGKTVPIVERLDEIDVDDGIECAVCQSTDGDPSDPIVFCDGCDLMVHSTCYGSPLIKGIPEGDWFCAQCLVSQSAQAGNGQGTVGSFACCLCPIVGGAMKPTNDGRWAHIVCAVYVPEVFFMDPEGREGIDFSRVPDKRWGQSCYVCESERGCAIDCSEPKCPLAFHVGCGLKEELCIEYREGRNKGAVVAGFCKKHTELWKKQQETGKFKIVARE